MDASDPQTWRRYTIKGEEFSVILPTMPALVTSEGAERQGLKAGLGRHLRTMLDDVIYGIDVIDNPNGQSMEELVVGFKAREDFTAERDIVVNGVSGKEFSKGRVVPGISQFFVTDRRLYRFFAAGDGLDKAAAVQPFFSSITLGKKGDAIAVSVGPGMPLQLDTGERIYNGGEVDQKVRLVGPRPVPEHSGEALGSGQTVILRAVFSHTGKVVNIQVLTPASDKLTQACIAATENIKFVPAMKNGKYVSTYMTLEYHFNSY